MSVRKTMAVMAGFLLAAPCAQAAQALQAKQLAGPPSDFAAMRTPAPAASAILSKTALIPVALTTGKSGAGWSTRIPVEGERLRVVVLSGGDRSWKLSMTSATGERRDAASLAKSMAASQFGLGGDTHPADIYTLDDISTGTWQVSIDAPAAAARNGFLLVEGDAATELSSHVAHGRHLVGESQAIVASLAHTASDDRIALGNAAGRIARASLRVTAPDGSRSEHPMADDGASDDGLAGDGVFGARFPAPKAGQYLAQVVIEGSNVAGGAILRSSEHVVPVVERSLALRGAGAQGKALDAGRLALEIEVDDAAKGLQHYRAWGEVWGRGSDGAPVAVAWVGGMVTPAAGRVSLALDERWLVRAGAAAPFEIRNLRLEHPDHSVTIAAAERLPLSLPKRRSTLAAHEVEIDDTMTMGPRPAPTGDAKAVGGKLMLVHGYCSGGVWPASQFSSAISFADFNQNRSHDQFARLIASFGAAYPSFGVVAHSQGGAASLHLYTYYWSGLDYATPTTARLIQSVGTPYQGTNLSGILASLGSWFGVGCGSNSDLTYSGASSWLAGIPASSRAKVNYYTTAFRSTNWYTNDYCNFATDLVLSDPEDGTTERAYGQLPSGVNRGHVTGQCHTAGMRDPAQYLDSSRNATMNANAAR